MIYGILIYIISIYFIFIFFVVIMMVWLVGKCGCHGRSFSGILGPRLFLSPDNTTNPCKVWHQKLKGGQGQQKGDGKYHGIDGCVKNIDDCGQDIMT